MDNLKEIALATLQHNAAVVTSESTLQVSDYGLPLFEVIADSIGVFPSVSTVTIATDNFHRPTEGFCGSVENEISHVLIVDSNDATQWDLDNIRRYALEYGMSVLVETTPRDTFELTCTDLNEPYVPQTEEPRLMPYGPNQKRGKGKRRRW